jgi:hypothetical protein
LSFLKARTLHILVVSGLAARIVFLCRRRSITLAIFNFFQAITCYGFGNWLSALVNAQS